MNNLVSLDYIDSYKTAKVQEKLEKAIEDLKLASKFKPKMKVLIKPCLPFAESQDKAKSTHPAVVRAVVNILSNMGVTCIVADSPFKKFSVTNLDSVYLNTGMLEVANTSRCELNHNLSTYKIDTPNGVKTKSLTLLEVVNEVDAIINIGKINIKENLGYVGATTNLFGLIPGELKNIVLNRLNTLRDYNHYILDLMQAVENKVAFNVLDGVVTLEAGDTQRMLYCLGVSENALSLDATIFDILGISYNKTILKVAEERGMFNMEKPYKLISGDIKRFKVEDFALNDVDLDSKINPNNADKKHYFKQNQQRIVIPKNKCKGCGICCKICPTGAIMMKYDKNGELYAHVDYSKCIFCFKCNTACPYSVIDVHTPANYKALKKDLDKYNEK